MSLLLDPIEQSIVRAWIKGIPLDALLEELPQDMRYKHLLNELKQRLTLKAKRLAMPWHPFFLAARQDNPVWEMTALNHLDSLIDQPDIEPSLDHPLDYWLDDAWLPGILDSGLSTIRNWFMWRQTQGNDWWRFVPGMGQKSAKVLDYRLHELFPEIHTTLLPLALPPIVYQTALVPLTHFMVPEECDG